jgi:hypothetical protein
VVIHILSRLDLVNNFELLFPDFTYSLHFDFSCTLKCLNEFDRDLGVIGCPSPTLSSIGCLVEYLTFE